MKRVTIYTTHNCHFCHLAKEYFKQHNVPYQEKDVETDVAAQREMIEKTGQFGVPVIELAEEDGSNPQYVIGFERELLARELSIA